MFTTPRPNFYQSSDGFSVEVLGRTGLRYREQGKSMLVDSDVLTGRSGLLIYRDTIARWDTPHEDEAVDEATRERVLENIRDAFRFQGVEIDVIQGEGIGPVQRNAAGDLTTQVRGRRVEHVDASTGGLVLRLEDGWTMSIYNIWNYRQDGTDVSRADMGRLVGARLADIETRDAVVLITFDSPARILVDLSDDAYSGPEAMQLSGPGGAIVVWN